MNGPATDHFFRSGEWKRNPPFFVPTATTTLPFLIERAMSTTGDAGEDVDDISGIQFRFRQRCSDEFLVHEDVHVRSEEHTSELQSRLHLVCRLLLEKK